MAKESRMGNLLKLAEYDHLQPKQSPTKYTEIGGYAVLEKLTVKQLLELAEEKTGKSEKELENCTPAKLKEMIWYLKEKEENLAIFEASEKQKAARKRFMEMIAKKKAGKKENKECKGKHCD